MSDSKLDGVCRLLDRGCYDEAAAILHNGYEGEIDLAERARFTSAMNELFCQRPQLRAFLSFQVPLEDGDITQDPSNFPGLLRAKGFNLLRTTTSGGGRSCPAGTVLSALDTWNAPKIARFFDGSVEEFGVRDEIRLHKPADSWWLDVVPGPKTFRTRLAPAREQACILGKPKSQLSRKDGSVVLEDVDLAIRTPLWVDSKHFWLYCTHAPQFCWSGLTIAIKSDGALELQK